MSFFGFATRARADDSLPLFDANPTKVTGRPQPASTSAVSLGDITNQGRSSAAVSADVDDAVDDYVAEGVICLGDLEDAKKILSQRVESIKESKKLLQAVVMMKKTELARVDELFGKQEMGRSSTGCYQSKEKQSAESIRVLLLSERLAESEAIIRKLDEHLVKVLQRKVECDLALSYLKDDACTSGSGDKQTDVLDSFATVQVPNQDLVGDGKALQSYATQAVRMAWFLLQM